LAGVREHAVQASVYVVVLLTMPLHALPNELWLNEKHACEIGILLTGTQAGMNRVIMV